MAADRWQRLQDLFFDAHEPDVESHRLPARRHARRSVAIRILATVEPIVHDLPVGVRVAHAAV